MSEILGATLSPEQRVFGNAFSFANGEADKATVDMFVRERTEAVADGDMAWLPRYLQSDTGVVADLYRYGKHIATLNFDYDTRLASVYTTSDEAGAFGDITVRDKVAFDEAVIAAEELASVEE